MGDILVLYKTKYGSSKQCAEWIASELGADLYEIASAAIGTWEEYSTIVYCGGLYANSLNGLNDLIKNQAKLTGKKIVVIACGLSDPGSEEVYERVKDGLYRKLPQAVQGDVKLFLLRGGITYSKLSLIDKAALKVVEKMLRTKKPGALSPEEQRMLEVLGKDSSFSMDRASIQPIIEYCGAPQGAQT